MNGLHSHTDSGLIVQRLRRKIWPTPEFQNNDFTGFLDLKNVGVGTEITFPSTLVSKL